MKQLHFLIIYVIMRQGKDVCYKLLQRDLVYYISCIRDCCFADNRNIYDLVVIDYIDSQFFLSLICFLGGHMLKEAILDDAKWNEFLTYKINKEFVSQKEKKIFTDFVLNKKYRTICSQIADGTYSFSVPKKHLISKGHSSKKRTVYTFSEEEMLILKFIAYLLYEYDYLFSPNLYSFRKNTSVKNAIHNLSHIKNLPNMYGYKVDISNYFNSIDIHLLLANLERDLPDSLLFSLIESILKNDWVEYEGKQLKEQKGVMAGTPISAFLANYYIREVDKFFWDQKLVYCRYADDIILFCNQKEELILHQKELIAFFEKYHLTINSDKEYFFAPKDKWEFLGFSFNHHTIDLSDNTIRKIKAKIRRSARGIRRWMLKKDAPYKIALKAMNRKYNRKFFGKQNREELSWKYWFFPTITTSESLKIIDNYMQEQQRYIVTGKHNKRNYKIVPYTLLKECHYQSLVHEYYKNLSLDVKH